ncbi:MAG: cob(I)yrinic acid a,c-diamide adenosyltransferase [Nocardioidaceae bacterium]
MTDDQNRTDPATAPHYTREGDDGSTTLGDLGSVGKNDIRVAAYADCGEANANIGLVLALASGLPVHVLTALSSVQHDLFDLVTGLGHAKTDQEDSGAAHITEAHIQRLESLCDHYSEGLSLVEGYVLPGGTVTSAQLFQAWSVTRRAERTVWEAASAHDEVSPLPARYLNRLSSLLFVLARAANAEHGDTMWYPMASVNSQVETMEDASEQASVQNIEE